MLNPLKTPRVALLMAALTLAGATFATRASAQNVLLYIDTGDPAAVTFTATGNAPSASDSSNVFNDGIEVAGFFPNTPSSFSYTVSSSTLTTFLDGSPVYDNSHSDNLSGGADVDFNLYTNYFDSGATNTERFATGSPAFAGVATVDLSSDASLLPSAGATGDIYAGYSGTYDGHLLIGTYVVVPEAGSGVFVLLGGVILLLARWYRMKLA